MEQFKIFDIIIIGGGHAGIEAAHISSQFNLQVALITLPSVPIGSAPCNPCVGGVGKGQVVRELDALGGIIGRLADKAGIQFRTLNESKGFAVQSTRVQIDKEQYSVIAEKELAKISNLTIIRDKVKNIQKDDSFLITGNKANYSAKKIVCTLGTFLNGKTHIGSEIQAGGRYNIEPSDSFESIFTQVKTLGVRFKTGTPPRIKRQTIDFGKLEEQPSDGNVAAFHWEHEIDFREQKQLSCYLTRTNEKSMEIIQDNKVQSPMYNGQIKAVGARYCPSIEDKAYRYPEKNTHHVFVEPEGLNTDSFYPSGISSSLPRDVQKRFVNTIKGLENAEILEYGYAVEYDVMDTTQLNLTLEHREIKGLYFAGQVNGTSGYEEAAGQGYIAGANAALSLWGQKPLILSRNDSYIGVMIEDLVMNKRDEPYRLFTARTENRLYIREDNSIIRMWSYRDALGLSAPIDIFNKQFVKQYEQFHRLILSLKVTSKDFGPIGTDLHIDAPIGAEEVLKRPEINPILYLHALLEEKGIHLNPLLVRTLAIGIKYQGYISRVKNHEDQFRKLEGKKIDWEKFIESENISYECKARIRSLRPDTFGQLKRIEGIRPATLAAVANTL